MGMGSRSVLLFNRVGSGGAAVLPHHPAYSRTNSFKQAEVKNYFSIYFIASVRKERNDKSFYGGRLFFYYFAFRILE